MVTCDYCGNDVGSGVPGESGGACHKTCLDEWNRRLDAGECVGCSASGPLAMHGWCRECLDGKHGLTGYPGGV